MDANISSQKSAAAFIAKMIAVITFFVYLGTLKNGFVNWDDEVYLTAITQRPSMFGLNLRFFRWVFLNIVNANWHPITMLSLAFDDALWGRSPFGYHLTNIILHCVNTFLVFVLAQSLTDAIEKSASITIPATTAVLFGIHPIHVESVAWVSERKDVLCAAFFLLSVISYVRYLRGPRTTGLYVLCFGLFALSLMSKPMAITLPIVLVILDFYPFRRFETEKAKQILFEKLPFILLTICASIVAIYTQNAVGALEGTGQGPIIGRVITAARGYMFYLIKIALPFNLAPYYPRPSTIVLLDVATIFTVMAVMTITYFAISCYKRTALFSAVWFYYVVTLLPVIGIVQVGAQAAADRYTYLPSIG